MTPLAGRTVLLIGIGFYDYEAAIATELRTLGAVVHVENANPPETRSLLAPVRRRLGWQQAAIYARHRLAMLERARLLGHVDEVMVIKGDALDDAFVLDLRRALPRARFTAYHWDSMARYPALLARQALFDRVLTFDHADAAAHSAFRLRPLFFRPELASAPTVQTLDLAFTGWLHHDRLRQIEALRAQAESLGRTGAFYLTTGRWTQLKLRLAGRGRDVHARSQPFSDYARLTKAAMAVIDLPHPAQTGLTMRAIETIGAGVKLITTAADIRQYDFYRPENICVIDPSCPRLDLDFLRHPSAPVPREIVDRYSLRSWVSDVVGLTVPEGFIPRSPDVRHEPVHARG